MFPATTVKSEDKAFGCLCIVGLISEHMLNKLVPTTGSHDSIDHPQEIIAIIRTFEWSRLSFSNLAYEICFGPQNILFSRSQMTDRRVDFTETESEDSSNEENVEPAENSHASSGLEGSFQLVPRRSENEQAEHDLVQDVHHAVKAREREAFLCTCQIGIKKELCKHILLVKHEKGEFRWPEDFAALPLNTKFTGRPRKRQLVTRYQGN
ncbi:hypothetical protein DdX_07125 [Ditylenchus destructor]|uniref:SWIM-type domain-containing protein n=1 Tax=Ditylenchus destructor TaxID=166010 RepID=A0AAD4NAT0_9BILA|nr:hypothetical protein DdX_07125 [Ditylenchus destructor]